MSFVRHFLAYATASLALLMAPSLHAQTSSYPYSVTLSVTAPIGSSAAAAAKVKTLPQGLKFSPCDASALDQFAFTLKYDAGKMGSGTTPSTLQEVYLIFHKDGSAYFPLVRQPLTNTANAFFKNYNNPTDIKTTDTYTASTNNLGGLQTEVILGGNLTVEGLDSGVWFITAIVAPKSSVNFDNPTTWTAWDTTAFMLRKPWKGTDTTTCS